MAENGKKGVPAYISPSFFDSFINGLRDTHLPPQIDRSIMSKASGSQISAMMTSLRALRMIDQDNKPTPRMKQYVEASDLERPAILKEVLREAYSFVINDNFDLEKATGQMVADKFRAEGVQGTTLSKAISFFLAMSKAADIKVSPLVKPPPAPPVQKSSGKKAPRRREDEEVEEHDANVESEENIDEEQPGMVRIQIPLHGMKDGVVFLPDDLSTAQWKYALKITKFLLDNYRPDAQAEEIKEKQE